MAQTLAQVKKGMTDPFINNLIVKALYGLTPGLSFEDQFSTVSIESILFDVVAFCIWTVLQLFDAHRDEVKGIIDATKPHRVQWYVTMALRFRFGQALVAEEDYYSDAGLTAAQVDASMIVKYAVVSEIKKGLRYKLATITNGDLAPLTTPQLTAFLAYIARVKDAGVRKIEAFSGAADSLRLDVAIYYDALILDANGARLDGTAATPIQDTLDSFLKSLPFNGLLALSRLEAEWKKLEGVVIPKILTAEARYGVLPYQAFSVEYLPDAGYLRILSPSDLTITFIPHEPI